jgi:hypothetical protein
MNIAARGGGTPLAAMFITGSLHLVNLGDVFLLLPLLLFIYWFFIQWAEGLPAQAALLLFPLVLIAHVARLLRLPAHAPAAWYIGGLAAHIGLLGPLAEHHTLHVLIIDLWTGLLCPLIAGHVLVIVLARARVLIRHLPSPLRNPELQGAPLLAASLRTASAIPRLRLEDSAKTMPPNGVPIKTRRGKSREQGMVIIV